MPLSCKSAEEVTLRAEVTWFHGLLGDPGSFYLVALLFVALAISELRLALLQLQLSRSILPAGRREGEEEVAYTVSAYILLPTI